METIQDFRHFSFSTQFAVITFAFGTLIFGLYFVLPENNGILIVGLSYIIFALFTNSIVVLNLLYQLIIVPEEREAISIKILIVLANIPIAIFYGYLVIQDIKSSFIL